MIDRATPERIEHIPAATPFSQPSCFFHRSLLRTPALDESYHYALDLELWAYFKSRHVRWKIIDNVLSVYVMGGQNKTSTGGEKITREIERVYTTYVHERVPLTWWVRISCTRWTDSASVIPARWPTRPSGVSRAGSALPWPRFTADSAGFGP